MVEYAVNAVYMLYIADAKTADSFNDYQDYLAHTVLLDLKGTDEPMLSKLVSAEEEELRQRLYSRHGRVAFGPP